MPEPENNISILIVENNTIDQLLLKENLQSSDLNISAIEMASTLGEAKEILKHETFSLIFLDLFLPDSSGLESFIRLAKINSSIPVIILSGLSDTHVSLKALSLGAQDFIMKGDFNNKILEKTISYSIERKKNLHAIEENEERFNLVSMATHDIVWDWNLKTDEVYKSKEGWEIILKSKERREAGTKDERPFGIHPDDRAKVNEARRNIFHSTGNLFEIECRVLSEDNKYIFVQDRFYVKRDNDGNPVRLIGATQDITQVREAEQKVLLSEKRFRSLVQNGSDLIAIIDEDANYIYVSPASKRILGYEPEFLVGKNALSFIHTDDLQTIRVYFEKMKETEGLDLPSYRFQNSKGQWRCLETHMINLLKDEAVNGIVVNSRDITEKKLAEEKIALERIYRQKEITEAIISAQESERSDIGRELHDNVYQLIGATRLYINMAIKDPANSNTYLESSSAYTLNAIDEIKRLSKTLLIPIKEIGLTESVKDTIKDIMREHPVKIELNALNFEEKNLNENFKLNLFRMVQVQLNNILKHAKANIINIDFNRFPDKISISIEDDGIGFNPSVSRKGMGISNLISRAELYNGSVNIDSSPGKGCKLIITFNKTDLLTN